MNVKPARIENIVTDKGKVPVYATGIVEQPWDDYSAGDHEVWRQLYQRQREAERKARCAKQQGWMDKLTRDPDCRQG